MKEEESLDMYLMDPCWVGRGEGCWKELMGGPYPLVDLAGMEDEERHSDSSVEVAVVVVVEEERTQPSCL